MKKVLLSIFAAIAAVAASPPAQADVVCDTCSYLQGEVATNLGLHNTLTSDNSTFGNSTSGTNGNFSNWWVFSIAPDGLASVNAIFLPIQNISNFDVDLYSLGSATCAVNTADDGGVCSAFGINALLVDGTTAVPFASVVDFTALASGFYAFNIVGTISGLVPDQPASYTGNLQVAPFAVAEPGTAALAGMGLIGIGLLTSRRRRRLDPEDDDEDGGKNED